jgi:hypothetical protein
MKDFTEILDSIENEDNATLIEAIREGYDVWLEAKGKSKKKKKSRRKRLPYASFGIFPDWSRATVGVESPGTDNGMGQGVAFAAGDAGGGGGE